MDGRIGRRELLGAAALLGIPPALAKVAPKGFTGADIEARAKALAAKPFVPSPPLPDSLKFTYDEYRMLRFHRREALWQPGPIIAEPMAPGGLFADPVALNAIEGGAVTPFPFDPAQFDHPPGRTLPGDPGIGFSGVRFLAPINRPDVKDEFAVFQGASYFRAVARGTLYGLSARAIAIGTGGPKEEFPIFRAFWLEKTGRADTVRVHGLVDGPSLTGVWHFSIRYGAATVFDVEAVIFPRTNIDAVGIAPMSSMFMSGPASARRFDDFRPAVHDSDGLEIWTGKGEQLWRPLTNPKQVELSAFADTDPRGFGLMQRARDFADYRDAEAHYEQRPGLWVEPIGKWGPGSIELMELPTDNETTDNIVLFWRPAKPLTPGRVYRTAYRLHWTTDSPAPKGVSRVTDTRTGASFAGHSPDGSRAFAVDFEGSRIVGELDSITADAATSRGTLRPVTLARLPSGDVRANIALSLQGAEPADLRLTLRRGTQQLSETFVARWRG